jgi:hypothetical protein
VVPAETGQADEIIYLEGFRPGGAEVDSLTGRRLVWDEAKKELKDRALASLPAVIAGAFPNPEEAREAATASCLSEYWVLPADRVGGPVSKIVLALVATRPQQIKAEMARPCESPLTRKVADFHPQVTLED